jgi:hypothetical protein
LPPNLQTADIEAKEAFFIEHLSTAILLARMPVGCDGRLDLVAVALEALLHTASVKAQSSHGGVVPLASDAAAQRALEAEHTHSNFIQSSLVDFQLCLADLNLLFELGQPANIALHGVP